MGRKPDLPCDIEQVVDLLGIEVIRDTGTQLHCRCPFCADRKAHMNVKIRDNVFRCNRCGKGGGILHLYAEFCEVTLHTAYEELCKMFGPDSNEKPREYKRRRKIIETAELPIASAEVRDNTYSNLLSLLTLCPTHQASLKERGLTRDEIDWLGYRTTPTTRLRRIVTELLERGCVLDGVPGFYCQKDTGQWTLDIRGSGIMLPDRNLNGQIEAIQVRLDKVYNQKFYNLTSIDQYYGTQSKCCPHYVGVHEGDEVVCLTEGVMKADIPTILRLAPHMKVVLSALPECQAIPSSSVRLKSLTLSAWYESTLWLTRTTRSKKRSERRVIAISKWGLLLALRWLRLPGHKSGKA